MTKQVKQLDRVIIRFAGDSGDGMQLTGDRFTRRPRAFGNDLVDAAELPRRDPGARRARCRASRRFQLHFADHDILTPGDAPDVLVAMNPAALQGEPRRPAQRGADDHRRHRRVHRAQPGQGRLRRQPARGRLARRSYQRAPGRPDHDDGRGGQGVRPRPARTPRAPRTCSRSGCCRGCTAGPTEGDDRRSCASASSPRSPTIRDANIAAFTAGLELRRDHRDFAVSYEVKPAADGRRAPTATSPATWRCPTAWSPPACRPGCRSSSARTRSPRPPTSCTS